MHNGLACPADYSISVLEWTCLLGESMLTWIDSLTQTARWPMASMLALQLALWVSRCWWTRWQHNVQLQVVQCIACRGITNNVWSNNLNFELCNFPSPSQFPYPSLNPWLFPVLFLYFDFSRFSRPAVTLLPTFQVNGNQNLHAVTYHHRSHASVLQLQSNTSID